METEEAAPESEEGLMDVGAPLIADGQPPIAVEPGERAFDDPTVPTQPLAGLHPFARDATPDVAPTQRLTAARVVIAFIRVQFRRAFPALPGGSADRRDGIEQVLKDDRLVAVSAGQERGEGESGALDHNMALRAGHPLGLAAIRRVRADGVAPLLAGMLAESSAARLQSMRSAAPSRSSSVWCKRSHTPAVCQSRKRRQHVTPRPQPNSGGSISQGIPLFRTKMMPVKAARSERRGRPPLGLGGSGGNNGSTSAHNSSLTSGLMPQVYHVLTWF
jgi:hypothetical protein